MDDWEWELREKEERIEPRNAWMNNVINDLSKLGVRDWKEKASSYNLAIVEFLFLSLKITLRETRFTILFLYFGFA